MFLLRQVPVSNDAQTQLLGALLEVCPVTGQFGKWQMVRSWTVAPFRGRGSLRRQRTGASRTCALGRQLAQVSSASFRIGRSAALLFGFMGVVTVERTILVIK